MAPQRDGVLVERGWDLSLIASSDYPAEHDSKDRSDDEPGEQGDHNPVHDLDNGPTRQFVTGW